MGYGGSKAYVEALRDVVVVMIEKQSAVDQLEEILDVDGVDMIQWGSADYSMNIGRPGERTIPEVLEAQEFIFRKALEKRRAAARGAQRGCTAASSPFSTWASVTSA